ncbi:hypothetical protein QFC22_005163 [Naganishia vaughanmartiniae]|uniref:Uncharacterized protein n=1 Tax=Naganishia vaughanmartiniae TaxID=1424756 RepID=A0ACC2WX69_9TREE|nr:hypothetical protein QFC22_005163 [Naganishia vaughanmartiniae]
MAPAVPSKETNKSRLSHGDRVFCKSELRSVLGKIRKTDLFCHIGIVRFPRSARLRLPFLRILSTALFAGKRRSSLQCRRSELSQTAEVSSLCLLFIWYRNHKLIVRSALQVAAERFSLHIATAPTLCSGSEDESASNTSSISSRGSSSRKSCIIWDNSSASSRYIVSGEAAPSTCRTHSASTTLFDDAILDGLPRSTRIKLETAAFHQARESEPIALRKEVERLRSEFDLAAMEYAEAMVVSEQRAAVATSQNVTLLQTIANLNSLVKDQGQIVTSLTAKVQQQTIEIGNLQTNEENSSRIIDILIRQDRGLRSARTQAEARASRDEARAEQAESKAASAEVKTAAAAVLIGKARATTNEYKDIVAKAPAEATEAQAKVAAAEGRATAIGEELDQLHIKLAILETENAEYSHQLEVLQTSLQNIVLQRESASIIHRPVTAVSILDEAAFEDLPEMPQHYDVAAVQQVNLRLLLLAHGVQDSRSWLHPEESEQVLDWYQYLPPGSSAPINEDEDGDASLLRLLAIRADVIARLNPNESLLRGVSTTDQIYAAPQAWDAVCHADDWSSAHEEDNRSESSCCYIVPSPTSIAKANNPETSLEDSDEDTVSTPMLTQLELQDDDTFFESHNITNQFKNTFTISATPARSIWIPYMGEWVSEEDISDDDEVDALTPSPTFQPCHAM